ncbi:phosphotransferase [Antrihabitans sp. YC2-6]|uniref:phosphotransferase n=1 Tax=Antrihabitans sp. YC2-6 TaxID=2799498 RepID=UPI0018F36EC6|nr:phosphotransferase [Antrihabitans sp. YC2-6]MBJ8348655.1 phosphotransferase [Antrihabitans sp. YC2-6]
MATTQRRSNTRQCQRLVGGWGGKVYRHGGTVRRETGPWTPAVHALLQHLESVGFAGAPRVLGVDRDGFEVLTFIDGQTCGGNAGWPGWGRADENLVRIANLLRRYHDAAETFRPAPGALWRGGRRELQAGEIIGHNDVSLANLVADSHGRVHSLIDWDQAGPTTRRADLAYAAWQVVGLHAPGHARHRGWTRRPDVARRLATFLDAYGLADRDGFVDDVCNRIARSVGELISEATRTGASVADFVALLEGDIEFVRANRAALEHAITADVRARLAA